MERFLSVFAKLWIATLSFVMSVSLPVYKEKPGSHSTDFNKIWLSSTFRKCVEKSQVPLKSDKNSGYFTWRQIQILFYLTPELNPSAQRCMTRFLMGILFLEPCISLIYAWKTNKYTDYSFSLLCTVAPTCFGITLPSLGSVPSAFWEMLNLGAVDRILWMGVLCLVTWCVKRTTHHITRHNTSIHNILNWASLRRH
jgi:hypothetical protein